MRSAGHGKFLIAKVIGIRRTALDEGQRLDGFDRGTRKGRTFDIAEREDDLAVSISDDHRTTMAAFDRFTPKNFNQHRIAHDTQLFPRIWPKSAGIYCPYRMAPSAFPMEKLLDQVVRPAGARLILVALHCPFAGRRWMVDDPASRRTTGATPTGAQAACFLLKPEPRRGGDLHSRGPDGRLKGCLVVALLAGTEACWDPPATTATMSSAGACRFARMPTMPMGDGIPIRPSIVHEISWHRSGNALIPKIEAAIRGIPLREGPVTTSIWPGPNSNSFVAHILRSVPENRRRAACQMRLAAISQPMASCLSIDDDWREFPRYALRLHGVLPPVLAADFEINFLGLVAGVMFCIRDLE